MAMEESQLLMKLCV